MLALTRKRKEKILIGDHIEITVIQLFGDRVRIGVKAPKDMRVDREEVRTRIEGTDAQNDQPKELTA